MSAVKIIFKRSSVLGKRPTGANLEAGEIGLNTNPTDPGLFFETNNGSVVKVGPTTYLPEPTTDAPARGELWVDTVTKGMSIGGDANSWQPVAAPFLGGTNGLTVFVAPEFPYATDALTNDGQTVPFVTINRAIIEVTKQIIQDDAEGVSPGNNRYLIMLVPGRHCVVNNPGSTVATFSVNFSANPYQDVTQDLLAQFNPDSGGGLILPRGVSVIGMDLKKCEIHPVYVPKYTHPLFPSPYQQVADGPTYQNQPQSSVFRWSGNTYISNFVGLDKIAERVVSSVSSDEETGFAIFRSERPHGLGYNDFVQVNYTDTTDQANSAFANGAYYVNPLNSFEFQLSPGSWAGITVDPVLASALPQSFLTGPSDSKFRVLDIYPYYVPPEGGDFETHLYSHHRLSIVKNASLGQLNDFYIKVQKAFPVFFGGVVNTTIATANPPEYEIVAPTDGIFPNNLPTNSSNNSSPYQNQVNHRSNYGMANGDFDGNLVTGFKSVISNSSTAVTLQKDPVAYQVYSTVNNQQQWVALTQYVQTETYSTLSIQSIPTQPQLQALNQTPIPNLRYYYQTLKLPNGQSTGITDIDNDFRHFGFRMRGPNSYMQAQSTYTIGAAISTWSMEGAIVSLTSATTNFGSVAFQAEGFAGIGTLGGANDVNKGFLQSGIVRPLSLLASQVKSDQQKRILTLGSRVVHVALDPNNPEIQLIFLRSPFDPASILPFSLRPDSAVFTTDGTCTYRAFFTTDGSPTVVLSESDPVKNPFSLGGAILRVRTSDSTIPVGPGADLSIPYIRRYLDPRTPAEKSYGFYIQSTNPTSQAPQLGSVLRLNQTGQNLSKTLKRNYQFDPGQYGGTAQIFTVDYVQTQEYSYSLNYNNKISDAAQSTNYVVYTSLSDGSVPWIQSIYDPANGVVPYYNPEGSYITYDNKNYYACENNLWVDLYYETNFTPDNGPTKVAPSDSNSPFVLTSSLLLQEPVSNSWEGYVPTDFYNYYNNLLPNGDPVPEDFRIPDSVKSTMTYMRGAVIPYNLFSDDNSIDLDDSTAGFGIIQTRFPNELKRSITVSDSEVVQTSQQMTTPYVATPQRARPSIIQMDVLAVKNIANPKQKLSVLQLTYNDTVLHPELANSVEFVRVITLTSNTIQVIRNYYPQASGGVLPNVWPKGTTITVCEETDIPEPYIYDPYWSTTKSTVLRYFQLLGYAPSAVLPYLTPRYSGDRVLLNTDLQLAPSNGYANNTAAWPVEFNNPSSIIANTHTWQYAGYFDYSRGLPKYQTNEISRKLQYDFLCTTVFGGRLTVVGTLETGNIVFFGPLREALTGNYYVNDTPSLTANNRQLYTSPPEVPFPNPVLVYSVDDISGLFDGERIIFPLNRGGYSIPTSQIGTTSLFVFIGGTIQIPATGSDTSGASYEVIQSGSGLIPEILFFEPPPAGASCDIRVVTSEDNGQTLEVVSFTLIPDFNGTRSTFDVSPALPEVTNLNSFVFLGGVEQNPFGDLQTSAAYTISLDQGEPKLTFIGGAPETDTTLNMRGILSGQQYRDAGVNSVYVNSVDDIAPLFDDITKVFPLTVNGVPLDPTIVNAENMFVSLGGVMQIPFAQEGDPLAGLAYTVSVNPLTGLLSITFASAPLVDTTCNIRVITSAEFITCPLPDVLLNPNIKVGPGIGVNLEGQLTNIDSGLIGG